MRRRCAKSLTGVADAEESAPEGSSAPCMTWEELLARAESDLDEKGREGYERSKAAAEKHVRRSKAAGTWFEVDVEGVRRVIVAYYSAITSIGGMKRLRKLFAENGVRFDDYSSGRKSHADFGLVMEYIRKLRNELAKAEAEELVTEAQDSQRRLVTEEGCELNQRAVELSLKATMKDVYGDGGDEKGSDRRKPIVYKFENLTANFIMSPAELAAKKLDGATPVSEVIDV